eukprot:maker-scaffold_31-snap-gene-2.7-mRNA-1 protein AED:0.07 eAED:0.07 QI:201/0.8/0.83/1/0.8/0.66/6/24/251
MFSLLVEKNLNNSLTYAKTDISLIKKKLKNIPEELFSPKTSNSLLKLNLSQNQITVLKNSFHLFSKLQYLKLTGNKIIMLPFSFQNLTSLKSLDVANNSLTSLDNLPINLEFLKAEHNKLKGLSADLFKCKNLIELNLSFNILKGKLPDGVGNLTSLVKLLLDNNNIEEVPSSVSNLKSLRLFSLANNQLSKLPAEVFSSTELDTLWLKGNADLTTGLIMKLDGFELFDTQIANKKIAAGLSVDTSLFGLD